ncbi:hypothetical protein EDD86DRAFT_244036 [Gorgonomyces haynaldii]|nr:hypothetical protein EDD86DRAFT_244036 [Gorgonomyces haynaldii]
MSCFQISGSRIAPEFNGNSIQGSPKFPFTNTAELDVFLQSYNDTLPQSTFECSTWNGLDQRFHTTMVIQSVIFASNNNASTLSTADRGVCTRPPTAFPLCRDTCLLGLQAISNIFSSANTCTQTPSPTAAAQRNKQLLTYQLMCNDLTISNMNQGTCIRGLASEIQNCGFNTAYYGAQYCTVAKSDPCCSYLGKTTGEWLDTYGTSTPTPPAQSSTINASIISAAIVAGVVLIGLGVVYFFYRKSPQNMPPVMPPLPTHRPTTVRNSSLTHRSGTTLDRKFTNLHMSITSNLQSHKIQSIISSSGSSNMGTYLVIYNYIPQLPDELKLTVGDRVVLLEQYSDGWGLGRHTVTGHEGAFPMDCLRAV